MSLWRRRRRHKARFHLLARSLLGKYKTGHNGARGTRTRTQMHAQAKASDDNLLSSAALTTFIDKTEPPADEITSIHIMREYTTFPLSAHAFPQMRTLIFHIRRFPLSSNEKDLFDFCVPLN